MIKPHQKWRRAYLKSCIDMLLARHKAYLSYYNFLIDKPLKWTTLLFQPILWSAVEIIIAVDRLRLRLARRALRRYEIKLTHQPIEDSDDDLTIDD